MKKYIVCNLYPLMAEKGIKSVSELQRMTGLARRTLDKVFHNRANQINCDTSLKLCEALNCDFSELYTMVDEEEYESIIKADREYKNFLNNGFVYFIKNESTGLIKIGKTFDLTIRLKQLKLQFGNELSLIHSVRDIKSLQLEKKFHSQYSHKRVSGEWFNLSQSDLETIKLN